jgi:hypothetical protein
MCIFYAGKHTLGAKSAIFTTNPRFWQFIRFCAYLGLGGSFFYYLCRGNLNKEE